MAHGIKQKPRLHPQQIFWEDEIYKEIGKYAIDMGIKKRDVVKRAVETYLRSEIQKRRAQKKEKETDFIKTAQQF